MIDTDLNLVIELIPYQSPLSARTIIDIIVNDTKVQTLSYHSKENSGNSPVKIHLPASLIQGRQSIEITFLLPDRRRPQFEPGNDIRSVGIALVSATLFRS